MKRLLIIALFATVSCTTTQPVSRAVNVAGLDFRDYTQEGFLMTPYQYDEGYDSRGIVSVTIWPEVIKSGTSGSRTGIDFQIVQTTEGEWLVERLRVKEALDEIYDQATAMDADAIADIQVNYVQEYNGALRMTGIEVEGFAIKRR